MERKILTRLGFKKDDTEGEPLPETWTYNSANGCSVQVGVNENGVVYALCRFMLVKDIAKGLKDKMGGEEGLTNFFDALRYFLIGGEIERGIKMFETFNANEVDRYLRNRE